MMIFMGLNLYDAYRTTELGTTLTVLHQNIRGLFYKQGGLICSLKTKQITPYFIFLTEHYLYKQILSLMKLQNHTLGSSDSCILNQSGSVCFYIRNDLGLFSMFIKTV